MNRYEAALKTADSKVVRSLDLTMFSTRDIAAVAARQPDVLTELAGGDAVLPALSRGNTSPLMDLVHRYRLELVLRAVAFDLVDYLSLRPLLKRLRAGRIADLGGGYGFLGYFAHAEFGSYISLLDIDSYNRKRRLFHKSDLGPSDLEVAKRFFVANGGAPSAIAAPRRSGPGLPPIAPVDLAISLVPGGTRTLPNAAFLRRSIRTGGLMVLDVDSANQPDLARLGAVRRIRPVMDAGVLRLQLTPHLRSRHVAA